MSKKTEPRLYIVGYIASKLAAGRRTNVWPYLPTGQVRDGAGQERVKDWVIAIQETISDDDLKKKVASSPGDVGPLGELASNELTHYLQYYYHNPE